MRDKSSASWRTKSQIFAKQRATLGTRQHKEILPSNVNPLRQPADGGQISNSRRRLGGYFLPLIMAIAGVVFITSGAIISLVYQNLHTVKKQSNSTTALNIAEAGINYYLWHLSHNKTDFCDGQICSGSGPFGPYQHEYKDAGGHVVGSYSLLITPDYSNGTILVKADGTSSSGEERSVVARLAVPSFAQYSFLTNSEVWFGDSEATHGLVHSNKGIHFDGTADSLVTAAVASYTPAACFGGDGQTHSGIWGNGGPQSYWNFPVPQVDFNNITSDLGEISTAAQENGVYLPTLVDSRGRKTYGGYAIQLNADQTFRLGRVTDRTDGSSNGGCGAPSRLKSLMQTVSWEPTNRAVPANGIIFVADNLWVWGTVSSRLTIASGRLPDNASTNTRVYLQNDINYTVKDGSVVLGIISQSDIVVNSDSEDNLNLDVYLLSQKGMVLRPYYMGNAGGNIKNLISIYGGIASNGWWTWSWVNGSGTVVSGYQNTSHTYDQHLAFNPPPMFPETGVYAILSWQEQPVF